MMSASPCGGGSTKSFALPPPVTVISKLSSPGAVVWPAAFCAPSSLDIPFLLCTLQSDHELSVVAGRKSLHGTDAGMALVDRSPVSFTHVTRTSHK
jgi:hypothetical protein